MLTRKVRESGNGLAVQIPSQLAQEHGISDGDLIEWSTIDRGVLRARRVPPEAKGGVSRVKKAPRTER